MKIKIINSLAAAALAHGRPENTQPESSARKM